MRALYIDRLVETLQDCSLDAMLICPSEELTFFAGFSPIMCERFQGLFIKKDGSMFYFCNLLTGDEVRHEAGERFPVYTWSDNESMTECIRNVFDTEGLSGKTIGLNSSAQAFNILDISAATGACFQNGVRLLEETRIIKTEEELCSLRQAARIADSAFQSVLPRLRPGMTEGDVHHLLTTEMERLGGSNAGALVASGPNAGFPHYCSYDRVLQKGDGIIMDFGCIFNGLHSDISRTVFLGPVNEKQKYLYHLLLTAQETAETTAVEGAWIPDIDAAARKILDEAGYGHTALTRTGHGIGYMTHEAPCISALNRRRLKRGMCFSIEPGIYLPGELGIRIEDIVAINLEGHREVLNKAPKELIVL